MLLRAVLCLLLAIGACPGALTKVRLVERTDVLEGASAGTAGPYERVIARVHFAVDPRLPQNRSITDLDRAPRNEQGLVEFSADLYVLKPRDSARGNGTLLFEVSNRGGKGMLSMFNFASGSRDPRTSADFGDQLLLEQGFTLAWLGWQFDVPQQPGMLRFTAPVARDPQGPIRGLVRSEFVPDQPVRSASLADRDHRAYATVDLNDTAAQLTKRRRVEDVRQTIPRSQWRFARDENGRAVPDATSVYLASGFEPGVIYEVVYTAQDPPVAGLGLAGVRDLVSFLKFGGVETLLGDQRKYLKRALGFGTSQSGRFLRTFLYQGFNEDEKQRRVFDGVWAHVAGAGRGAFNVRFAQPSRDARPFLNFFYPVDIFPFTDLPETDPQTGDSGALLTAAERANVTPKIFYTNGAYEYWGRTAALVHVTPDGKTDATLAKNTRVYFIAGAQHGPGAWPPTRSDTAFPTDPLDYRYVMRGLLLTFQTWLQHDIEPPQSRYPLITKDQLVAPGALSFPQLPGVALPKYPHKAYRVDYGAEFLKAGIVHEPPVVRSAYPVLVPQVDADGNERSGVRLPELQVPLGTYTGWNFRNTSHGAPDEMASFLGSYFPFARTKAERLRLHDHRLSREERYPSRDVYLDRIRHTASELVQDRFVLERDAQKLVDRATRQWDSLPSE